MAQVDTPHATLAAERRHGPVDAAAPRTAAGVSRRELAIAWAILLAVGVAAYAANIRDSGFSTDDWSNALISLKTPGGVGGVLSAYEDITAYRPILILYVPLTYWVFGTHMGLHLAWAVGLGIFVSAMLYGVLRECGLRRVHALLIGALVLVYPWSDTTRFWPTASMASLSIGLALAGVWVALVALRRRSWRLHALAVALYLLSVLTYELTAAMIAAAGLLYIARAGWRVARTRWGADLAAVVAAAAWNSATTPRPQHLDVSALWSHFKLIVDQGGVLAARSIVPVGLPNRTLVLGLLAAVFVVGALLAWSRRGRPASALMRPWLALGLAGAVVVAAGWLIFVPTDPYYTPSIYGFTNRVNALAALGLVMVIYAAAGIVGALITAARPRAVVAGAAVTVVLGLVLGGAYVKVLERHSDLWVNGFRGEMSALGSIKSQYPQLPAHSTLLTFGYPGYQAPGVPIFAVKWDLKAALQIQYDDTTLRGYPVVVPTRVRCEQSGVVVDGGAITGIPPISYGRAILFDVPSGSHAVPRTAAACRRALPRFVPGQIELSAEY